MFADACSTIMKSLYAIVGMSQVGKNELNASAGSAFMVAPGVLVTVAHLLHRKTKVNQPRHEVFYVIHAPDIGRGPSQTPTIIAEDTVRDIGLLRLDHGLSTASVTLETGRIQTGTPCGYLGFPFARMLAIDNVQLPLRFQGAHVAAFQSIRHESGRDLFFYETDRLMYRGSSGCPTFTADGRVFGMHAKSLNESSEDPAPGSNPEKESHVSISLSVPADDIVNFLKAHKLVL